MKLFRASGSNGIHAVILIRKTQFVTTHYIDCSANFLEICADVPAGNSRRPHLHRVHNFRADGNRADDDGGFA